MSPKQILFTVAVALFAIWLSNNVGAVKRFTG